MAFVVIYDANVLYGNTLRDLLIRVAATNRVQAKWSDDILDEVFRTLVAKRPDIESSKLKRLRDLMNLAFRDPLVEGYQPLIDTLDLPDPNDRHVLAAAIRAGAQVIVTANLKDFPADRLAQFRIEAKSPDDFILDQIGLDFAAIWTCVQRIADSRRNPPETIEDVLDALENAGLLGSVAALRRGPL